MWSVFLNYLSRNLPSSLNIILWHLFMSMCVVHHPFNLCIIFFINAPEFSWLLIKIYSGCFLFFCYHKEGWSKHRWTYTFKYMSNFFLLGVELLGQTVCIFKIPIHVIKQLCGKLILFYSQSQDIRLPLSPSCQHWVSTFFKFSPLINKKLNLIVFEWNWLVRMNLFLYVYWPSAILLKTTPLCPLSISCWPVGFPPYDF